MTPPQPDPSSSPTGHPDHEPPLCWDLPIGRVLNRLRIPTYLALDVELFTRDTNYFQGSVQVVEHKYRVRGPVAVLSIQVRVRPVLRGRKPTRWVTGFDEFGDPAGPWPLPRFQPEPGIEIADLLRVAALSRTYNRNLKPGEPRNLKPHNPEKAVLIPPEVQTELREIVARLSPRA